MFRLRLTPENTNINFLSLRFIAVFVSSLVAIGGVILILLNGLNLGIDFKGGITLEFSTQKPQDLTALRNVISDLELGDFTVKEFGSPTDLVVFIERQEANSKLKGKQKTALAEANNKVNSSVKMAQLNKLDKANLQNNSEFSDIDSDLDIESEKLQQDTVAKVQAAIIAHVGSDVSFRRVEVVGPKVSGELVQKGILAVFFSLLLMLVYIWFRFEWQFSVAAIVALVHDILITVGIFAITRIEFNLSIIAALLTIVGYSMNDTVIVFDRVRENLIKFRKKPLFEILNNSLNETFSRTIMTSVTTLIALAILYVFGGETLRGFTFTMIWGVIIGTYSSIFIASPIILLTYVRKKEDIDTNKI